MKTKELDELIALLKSRDLPDLHPTEGRIEVVLPAPLLHLAIEKLSNYKAFMECCHGMEDLEYWAGVWLAERRKK